MAQINKPSEYFNTVLYTGTGSGGSNRQITGVGFQPDWVWVKTRGSAQEHVLSDSVRGATKALDSQATTAEETTSTRIGAFISDGFQLGSGALQNRVNENGVGLVAWNWLANGTGVSNTDGSITSTVSANTTSGFSIVSYTGNRTPTADQSIGHGLGAVPSMMIVKNRSNGSRGWRVYHKSLGTPDKELILNSTAAVGTDTATWGNTTPTSSVFYVGASGETNTAGENHIAYCFAEKKGFSKFGSYTGNGSADGTFVYTGFKPAMIIAKNTEFTDNWIIMDNKRANTYNPQTGKLLPNDNATEDTTDNVDFLSNGFKLRETSIDSYTINRSGDKIIYMAFAENPLVGTNNIPATAR